MYATRRPSTRRQVVGTFDVTKETAGAEVGDFPPFFCSRQVGLSRRLLLFVDGGHCLPYFADEQFAFLPLRKKRTRWGGGSDRGRRVPPYLQELNDRSVSRTEQKVIYIQFRKSQMSIG